MKHLLFIVLLLIPVILFAAADPNQAAMDTYAPATTVVPEKTAISFIPPTLTATEGQKVVVAILNTNNSTAASKTMTVPAGKKFVFDVTVTGFIQAK